MENIAWTIKMFILKRQPGPGGYTCCGPIGQTSEQIQDLQAAIESATGCQVEVYNVGRFGAEQPPRMVVDLMSTLGIKALPIVIMNDEAVSIGKVTPEPIIAAIKAKLAA
ncbi:hypothetical protein U27_03648 [Candidatus Vecturithrix granuli]|uniref:Thioredoxin-like fold domain-containing protein n=1 Tax=Vecturithrix granuli TaxID=1499967 RepID=A0A081BWI0_VECG1|nr:hypothetical protein U27_03648 [Candidatus Vecturithrix granuli]